MTSYNWLLDSFVLDSARTIINQQKCVCDFGKNHENEKMRGSSMHRSIFVYDYRPRVRPLSMRKLSNISSALFNVTLDTSQVNRVMRPNFNRTQNSTAEQTKFVFYRDYLTKHFTIYMYVETLINSTYMSKTRVQLTLKMSRLKVYLVKNACWLWLICICVYIAYFFTI